MASQVIRANGLPFDTDERLSAEALAQLSVRTGVTFSWNLTETEDFIEVELVTSADVEVSAAVFAGGRRTLTRRATARLPQREISATERRRPKLVLLLDYSGSMDLAIDGSSTRRAIDVLEDSIDALLAADLEVDYAAALYNSRVFDSVAFGPSAVGQIRDAFDRYDAGGGTDYTSPLRRATSLLTSEEDTGYYVLMVSDGAPNSSAGIARAAQDLWEIDATIFSLEIRRSGSTPALSRNLIRISGTPGDRGSADYHFVAESPEELVERFESIIAEIVCRAGPVDPAPADPTELSVILSKPGFEDRILRPTNDVFAEPGAYAFNYDPETQMVQLTDRACSAVLDSGYRLISRSQRGRLTN